MRVLFTIGLSIITILASAQNSRHVKYVDSLIAINQYSKVLPYLENELKQQPKNEELLRMLGFHNMQQNNLEAGQKYYQSALMVNPACARCYLNLGNIEARMKSYQLASEYFEKGLVIDTKDALLFTARGRLKKLLGDTSGAVSDLNKAIILDSTDYLPYHHRAGIYHQQHNYFKALQDVHKAIKLSQEQQELYFSEGEIYYDLKQYDQALKSYSKAIEIKPDYYLAYLNRAKIFYQLENLDASCSDNQTAKRLMNLAQVDEAALVKQVDDDLSNYCDAGKASYYYQRGIANYNLKKYHQAVELYQIGLGKFHNNAMLLSFKGNAYLALNDYKNALTSYNAALRNRISLENEIKQNKRLANPTAKLVYETTLANVYYGIAECKVNLGLISEALVDINEAIMLNTNKVNAGLETCYNLRGNIFLATGEYNLALKDFTQSIQINKEYAIAYVNRAIAKASLTQHVKINSFSLRKRYAYQPLDLNWLNANKSFQHKIDGNLISAVEDCNIALGIDNEIGFGYHIRGQLKHLLSQKDYCIDLLKAKALGQIVEDSLLKECNNQ